MQKFIKFTVEIHPEGYTWTWKPHYPVGNIKRQILENKNFSEIFFRKKVS